jgi:integrase
MNNFVDIAKIRDNNDGTFSYRLSLGYQKNPRTGNRKQIKEVATVQADNKEEALALLILEKKRRVADLKNAKSSITMAECIERYYAAKKSLSPNSKSKDLFYKRKINKRFGNEFMQAITSKDLLEFLAALEEDGYKQTTLRNFRSALRKYFNFAARQKFIQDNPIIQLADYDVGKGDNPRKNQSETVSESVKTVIRYIFKHKHIRSFSLELKVQILLSLDGCLRPTELYGLVWDNVNLEEGYMWIKQDLSVLTEKDAKELNLPRVSLNKTKTGGSERKLPLSKITIDYLKQYKEEAYNFLKNKGTKNSNNFLFFQRRNLKKGKDVNVASGTGLRTRLYKVSKYLQVKDKISPYDLRRLARTERENELDLRDRVNKYVIGHVKDNTTADPRYITTMYKAARTQHPLWEKLLNAIIVFNEDNKTFNKTSQQ